MAGRSTPVHGGPRLLRRCKDDAEIRIRALDASGVGRACCRFDDGEPRAQPDRYRGQFGDLPAARPIRRRPRALCAPTTSRRQHSKLIESAINGMLRRSIRTRPTSIRRTSTTCRSRPAANSAASVSRSRWRDGVVKVVAPSTTPPPPGPASYPATHHRTRQEPIRGLTLDQSVEKMRGPASTPRITLTIERKGVEKPFDVKLVRDEIHHPSGELGDEDESATSASPRSVSRPRQPASGDREDPKKPTRSKTSSKATSSTCATIPAASSIRPSRSPTPSLDRGADRARPSGRHARTRSGRTRPPATSPTAADHRAVQWRFGLGVRNRRRCAAGSSPRHHHRHAVLRQRIGADHHPARRERCVAA